MTNLTFVIPLRAKSPESDWKLVSRLCIRTIESCLLNPADGIKVLVVGHDKPDGIEFIKDKRFEFLHATSDRPEQHYGPSGMQDKWRKLSRGLIKLSESPPDYIMFVDADDLVSQRIFTHLRDKKPKNGLILRKGYRYRDQSIWIFKDDGDFNCGTNAVIATDAIYMPSNLTRDELRKCIALAVGHMEIAAAMEKNGTPLSLAPFPAAVYVRHEAQHSVNGFKATWTFKSLFSSVKSLLLNSGEILSWRLARTTLRDFVP